MRKTKAIKTKEHLAEEYWFVRMFLVSEIVFKPGEKLLTAELHRRYLDWLAKNGQRRKKISTVTFTRFFPKGLPRNFIRKGRDCGRGITNYAFREDVGE